MSLDRSLLIDGLKALAAQTIVIHHLVSYGPLAAAAVTMLSVTLITCFYPHPVCTKIRIDDRGQSGRSCGDRRYFA